MENEKLHLRYSSRQKAAYIFLTVVYFLFIALLIHVFRADDSPLWGLIPFAALLAFFAAFCVWGIFETQLGYVELEGRQLHIHRFLFSDKRFSLDEISGMRMRYYAGNGFAVSEGEERATLFCGNKRIMELAKNTYETDELWNTVLAERYPAKLYKDEDARHFAVKTHRSTLLIYILLVLLMLGFALAVCGTEDTEILYAFAAIIVLLPFAFLLERRLYIDGDELSCGSVLHRKKAHVSELYYFHDKKKPLSFPQLRIKGSNECFLRLCSDRENSYALKLYFEDHGIPCYDFLNPEKLK